MPAILRCTSLLLTLITLSSAVLVNRTIDDQLGDPTTNTYPVYSPVGDWQQGATCSDCAIKPDVSKAFDGTWHDSTFYPGSTPKSVSVTFNGSAVYAFFITSPVLTTTTTTQTHLNFTLDNTLVGAFDFTPDASSTYTYNHSVFSKAGLSDAEHTLVMTTGGTTAALLLFDYVIYTTDEAAGATSASSSASVGHSSSSASSGGSSFSTSPGAVASSTSPGTASSETAAGSSSSKSSGALSKTGSAKIVGIVGGVLWSIAYTRFFFCHLALTMNEYLGCS